MGVKAEVERTRGERWDDDEYYRDWVELSVEIPGARDDDAGTAFLGEMLAEAILADGEVGRGLRINRGWHWRVYLDVSAGCKGERGKGVADGVVFRFC